MIYACYVHHDKSFPIPADQAEGTVPHKMPFDDVWTSILLQCILSLMEIDKYTIYNLLPRGAIFRKSQVSREAVPVPRSD